MLDFFFWAHLAVVLTTQKSTPFAFSSPHTAILLFLHDRSIPCLLTSVFDKSYSTHFTRTFFIPFLLLMGFLVLFFILGTFSYSFNYTKVHFLLRLSGSSFLFCFSFSLFLLEIPLFSPHTTCRTFLYAIFGAVAKTDPERKLRAAKEKGPIGAPRALISSEGRGITRPRELHAQTRMGSSARRVLLYAMRGAE